MLSKLKRFPLQYVEATAEELETKEGLLSGCGDPTFAGKVQQFYSVLTSSLEVIHSQMEDS